VYRNPRKHMGVWGQICCAHHCCRPPHGNSGLRHGEMSFHLTQANLLARVANDLEWATPVARELEICHPGWVPIKYGRIALRLDDPIKRINVSGDSGSTGISISGVCI
jgi:hypothetical protein